MALGPLEWVSAVECEAVGASYVACSQDLRIELCAFPSLRYCEYNRFNLFTTDSITKESGDYIVRGGVVYDDFSVTSASSISLSSCTPWDSFSGTRISWSDPTLEYPFPAGQAEDMAKADVLYYRSDDTLVATWTFDGADICHESIDACPDDTLANAAIVVYKFGSG